MKVRRSSWQVSRVLGRILMEHIDMKNSLESQLFFAPKFSAEILNRIGDIRVQSKSSFRSITHRMFSARYRRHHWPLRVHTHPSYPFFDPFHTLTRAVTDLTD